MPKFSVRGIWQRWRESYPKDGTKIDDAITVFTGVCPYFFSKLNNEKKIFVLIIS